MSHEILHVGPYGQPTYWAWDCSCGASEDGYLSRVYAADDARNHQREAS